MVLTQIKIFILFIIGGTVKKIFLLITFIFSLMPYAAEWRATANPCPRSMAGLITDSLNQRLILFGGGNYRLPWGECFNDVWVLDYNSEAWKLLAPSGSPPQGRYSMAVTYDALGNRLILYGGRTAVNHYHDVWALTLTPGNESWIQINPSGAPPEPFDGATAVMDPVNNRLIIFGGMDENGQEYNNVWALNFSNLTWTLLNPSGSLPPPRCGHIAVYDPSVHQMVIFGGATAFYNDVWTLDLNSGNEAWHQIFPSGTPPGARIRHWGIYDSSNQEMVVGFGYYFPGFLLYYNDVWALDLTNHIWHQILPGGVNIEGRRGTVAGYDPLHHRIYVFGGDQYYDYYFGDTYVLKLDTLSINENKYEWAKGAYIKIAPNPVALPCQINLFVPYCQEEISLKIFDNSGRLVKVLIQGTKGTGNYIIEWDGKDDRGQQISTGTYFIKLNIDGMIENKKLIVVK